MKKEKFKHYFTVSFPPYACVYDEHFDTREAAEKWAECHKKRTGYKIYEKKVRLIKQG